MKLDLISWSVRLNTETPGGTPSWGTALGQGKGYLYSFADQDKYLWAMDKCAVNTESVDCPMGRGGNNADGYEKTRAAVFDHLILHNSNEAIQLNNVKLILLEVKQSHGVHEGRKILKYSPQNRYSDNGNIISNNDCFSAIERQLDITNNDGWFVSEIWFEKGNEVHLNIHIIRGSIIFPDIISRKRAMLGQLKGIVSHYTSLDSAISILKGITGGNMRFRATKSDCLNDPNECNYATEMCDRIFSSKTNLVKPYILSFCKTSDSPIMWRLYESKIQLVFNRSDLELSMDTESTNKVKLSYGDVLYHDLRKIHTQKDFKNETGILLTPKNKDEFISLIKHVDYSVEDEWRIIATETELYIQPEKEADLSSGTIGLSSSYDLVKMYREIKLPISALKEIIIYEFDDIKFSIMKSQLRDILDRKNIVGITIRKTECAGIRKK